MNRPTNSVVIPAYNCQSTIAKTIFALLNQTVLPNEIIAIDDGSKDNTAKIIQSHPQVKYFFQTNAGPAAARNHGASKATSEIIFFTDSDCVPQKDWIEKALKNFSDASIGVVAGSYGIANPQSSLAQCIHQEIRFRHLQLMPKFPKAFGSYNFAIRKNLFEKVGGFNTGYRQASGEDNDLSYKVLKSGARIYFDTHVLVDHFHTSALMKYLKEQFRHGYWRVPMYLDHPEMSKGDDYTFWKDIVEIPMVFLMLVTGLCGLFFPALWFVTLIVFSGFIIMQLVFSFLIMRNLFLGFFLFFTMSFRAFFRAAGFTSGIFHFLPKKLLKKSN